MSTLISVVVIVLLLLFVIGAIVSVDGANGNDNAISRAVNVATCVYKSSTSQAGQLPGVVAACASGTR